MTVRGYRRWSFVHTWSSLISTVFLLMLCVTGLPLIFHHEILELTTTRVPPAPVQAMSKPAHLDRVVEASKSFLEGYEVQFIYWDDDDPGVVLVSMGRTPTSDPADNRLLRVDEVTAEVLDEAETRSGVLHVLYQLHADMFLGLPGKLFLGGMGLMFIASIVSGVVVYGPSMRKLKFGDVRWTRAFVVRWLDLHNLTGMAIAAWILVVGFTGVINTLSELVISYWQQDQLADMIGPYRDRPRPEKLGSVQKAFEVAQDAGRGQRVFLIGFPGSFVSSSSHYAIFFKGDTPLTSRLLTPVIVDALEPKLTDTRAMPWYVTALLISEPLHFGDYGGLPMKIIWATLDVIAIAMLVSGIMIWVKRRTRERNGPVEHGADLSNVHGRNS